MIFCPIMCMYISCVGLCVHGFMNPLPSWFVCVFSKMFQHIVLCFRLLYAILRCQMFMMCAYARARVCVIHWHCTAQLSMFNMEKRYRNKIIIIIIITSVCTLNSLCPYFQFFFTRFSLAGAPPISQNKNSVKGQFFYLSSCKNSVWTHIFNYTDVLHSDNFILFTSVKVVVDWRPQNTFSKNNAPCVLLLLMLTRPFLNACCLVRVCFLGFMHSSSSSLVLLGRWLTSVKSWCSLVQ